jgi:hypothetical protein
MFPGSTPAYGISFVDENGSERFFSINLSGRGIDEAPPYYLFEENGNTNKAYRKAAPNTDGAYTEGLRY